MRCGNFNVSFVPFAKVYEFRCFAWRWLSDSPSPEHKHFSFYAYIEYKGVRYLIYRPELCFVHAWRGDDCVFRLSKVRAAFDRERSKELCYSSSGVSVSECFSGSFPIESICYTSPVEKDCSFWSCYRTGSKGFVLPPFWVEFETFVSKMVLDDATPKRYEQLRLF